MAEFQLRRNQFSDSRIVQAGCCDAQQPLSAGEVLTRIECFAYSANNITYAAAGDLLGYWQFFPAAGDDAQHWGITPVWGLSLIHISEPTRPY